MRKAFTKNILNAHFYMKVIFHSLHWNVDEILISFTCCLAAGCSLRVSVVFITIYYLIIFISIMPHYSF